jgi:KaiC/GvpD/RAD55 family RecA-like ATPase
MATRSNRNGEGSEGEVDGIATGVEGFDAMVGGSLPPGRLYVVSGPPGSGKTTLSAQFVTEGIRRNERCLYVSMHETESELIDDMSGYDFPFDRAVQSETFQFVNLLSDKAKRLLGVKGESATFTITNATNRLRNFIESNDIDRVVFDSTMVLDHYFEDADDVVVEFLLGLKRTDATIFVISEMTDPTAYGREHYLSHGVVFLHNFLDRSTETGGMARGLQIIKMRGRRIEGGVKRLAFSDDGLEISPDENVTW